MSRKPSPTNTEQQDEDAVSTAVQNGEKVDDIPLQSVQLLRKLISFKEINRIAGQRSDVEGLKQTAFHGGCILASGILINRALYFQDQLPFPYGASAVLFSVILHAFFLSFLFMPLHECVHLTAFKSSVLNRTGALVTGLMTLRPPVHYKLYHFAHHRHTGNKDKDPELSDTLLDPDINSISGYLLYLSSFPFWVSRPSTVVRHSLGSIDPKGEYFIATDDQKRDIIWEARMFVMIYVMMGLISYFVQSSALLVYWVIPTIIGQPFLRFYLLSEHTGCQLGANMLSNTRTTITYLLYRRLAWNMPYHSEHHAWPSVPFHMLPKVHRLIGGSSVQMSGCNPTGEKGYFHVQLGLIDQIIAKGKNKSQ